jgi:hypothetical protein
LGFVVLVLLALLFESSWTALLVQLGFIGFAGFVGLTV